MGAIFSKKKKNRVTEHDKAVLDLKVKRDKLKVYKKKVEKIITREVEMAKQLAAAGQKENAMRCLRRKKMQTKSLENLEVQFDNLQQMIDTVEFAKIEKDVFDGLKQGNEVLKELQKEMSVEDVEKLMDETQEAMEWQKEIDALLGESLTPEDDEAAQEELDRILAEEMGLDEAPTIPTHEPEVSAQEPEAEEEPERQMAMA